MSATLRRSCWIPGSRARTPEEVAAGFTRLGEALAQARDAYRRTREYDEALFGEDLSTL